MVLMPPGWPKAPLGVSLAHFQKSVEGVVEKALPEGQGSSPRNLGRKMVCQVRDEGAPRPQADAELSGPFGGGDSSESTCLVI
jgi:hypothetical protein